MKNENDQAKNGSHRDKKDEIEEIPLWLQGLQEHEDDDTNPIEVEDSSGEDWVDEVHAAEPVEIEPGQEKASTPTEKMMQDESYPDWLSELAEVDPAKPPVLDQKVDLPSAGEVEELQSSLVEGEAPQELELKQIPSDSIPDEVDDAFEDLPAVESEIEYRQSDEVGKDMSEKSTTENEMDQDELTEMQIKEGVEESESPQKAQDEELPPWLQEMIAEPQEIPPELERPQEEEIQQEEERDKAISADEPTEPIQLSGESLPQKESEVFEPIIDEESIYPAAAGIAARDEEISTEEEIWQAIEEEEENPPVEADDSMPSEESPPSEWVPEQVVEEGVASKGERLQPEMPASDISGDTNPVETREKDAEIISENEMPSIDEKVETPPVTPPKAPAEAKVEPPDTLPEELQEAKQLLSSGKVDQALKIIRNFDERTKYTHKIGTWLIEASKSVEGPNVGFWELLGDTALENDQQDLALDAYTKAIQSLLESQED